jgi:hypothetical protein
VTFAVPVPSPSSEPAPAVPEYSEIANVALPAGADTGIVHVRVAPDDMQFGDVELTSLYAGVPPSTAIPIDVALGETKSVRRSACVLPAAEPIEMTMLPAACGPDGVAIAAAVALTDGVEPEPPPHAASAMSAQPASAVVIVLLVRRPANICTNRTYPRCASFYRRCGRVWEK